jgi:hypothetical protein
LSFREVQKYERSLLNHNEVKVTKPVGEHRKSPKVGLRITGTEVEKDLSDTPLKKNIMDKGKKLGLTIESIAAGRIFYMHETKISGMCTNLELNLLLLRLYIRNSYYNSSRRSLHMFLTEPKCGVAFFESKGSIVVLGNKTVRSAGKNKTSTILIS